MTYLRKDVWAIASDDPIITAYGDAVAAMRAKAATDPTSWTYQAAIHGTHDRSPLPQWNQCRHGTWYFLPWHRLFLYYFERIVRAQVVANGGPSTWALPYWNYEGSNDNALPIAFRQPTRPDGSANPLYIAQRAHGINSGAGLPPAVTSDAAALACASFTGPTEFGGGVTGAFRQFDAQTGQLENQPHNIVHTSLGGRNGLMSDPDTAALDPIFWLHHANIDRLWWYWQKTHPGDPADPQWAAESYSFFDVGGAPVTRSDAEAVDAEDQLDYTYGPLPVSFRPEPFVSVQLPRPWPAIPAAIRVPSNPNPGRAMQRELIGSTEEPVRLVGETARVTVTVDERAAEALGSGRDAADYQHRVFLDVENIDAERDPGIVYGVYVNLPDQPTSEDLAADRAGSISFFGIARSRDPRGDAHAHGLRYTLEITGILTRLAAQGSWQEGGRLDVTFQPLTLEPPSDRPELASELAATQHPDVPVTIGRIGIYYG